MKSELWIEFAICNLEFGNRNLEFRTDEKSSGYRDTHTQFSDGKLHLKTPHNPSEGVIEGEFLYESGDCWTSLNLPWFFWFFLYQDKKNI